MPCLLEPVFPLQCCTSVLQSSYNVHVPASLYNVLSFQFPVACLPASLPFPYLPGRRAVRAFPRLAPSCQFTFPAQPPQLPTAICVYLCLCELRMGHRQATVQQCGSSYTSLQQFNKAVLQFNSAVLWSAVPVFLACLPASLPLPYLPACRAVVPVHLHYPASPDSSSPCLALLGPARPIPNSTVPSPAPLLQLITHTSACCPRPLTASVVLFPGSPAPQFVAPYASPTSPALDRYPVVNQLSCSRAPHSPQ